MNTVQLECFLTVADNLNFARAAKHLHITQPAVTHQIHSLEEELGTRLFHRTTRSVELTTAGWNFLADAENILKLIRGATARISHTEQDAIQIFGIGAHRLLEPRFLPAILREFTRVCPSVHPALKMMPHSVLETMLIDESIAVLFGFFEKNPKQDVCTFCKLLEVSTACVVSDRHPFAHKEWLTLEDLKNGPMIISDPRHNFSVFGGIQNQVASFRRPSDLYFADEIESAQTLVKADLGFFLLPDLPQARDPSLRYIPVTDAPVLTFGFYHKAGHMSAILKQFIAVTKACFK